MVYYRVCCKSVPWDVAIPCRISRRLGETATKIQRRRDARRRPRSCPMSSTRSRPREMGATTPVRRRSPRRVALGSSPTTADASRRRRSAGRRHPPSARAAGAAAGGASPCSPEASSTPTTTPSPTSTTTDGPGSKNTRQEPSPRRPKKTRMYNYTPHQSSEKPSTSPAKSASNTDSTFARDE